MMPKISKVGEKELKLGLFEVLSFKKILQISLILDQKEQNCFGHPQFYCSIAPKQTDSDLHIMLYLLENFFYNCHSVKSSLLSLELLFRSLLQGRQTSK